MSRRWASSRSAMSSRGRSTILPSTATAAPLAARAASTIRDAHSISSRCGQEGRVDRGHLARVHTQLGAESEVSCFERLGAHSRFVVQLGARRIDRRREARDARREDELGAVGRQLRIPRVGQRKIESEVERPEYEPTDTLRPRKFERIPDAARSLDQRQYRPRACSVHGAQVRRILGLGKHDCSDTWPAAQGEVAFEPRRAERIDAHDEGARRIQHRANRIARTVLVFRRDRILDVRDHDVGAGRTCLVHSLRSRAGDEQVRAREALRNADEVHVARSVAEKYSTVCSAMYSAMNSATSSWMTWTLAGESNERSRRSCSVRKC